MLTRLQSYSGVVAMGFTKFLSGAGNLLDLPGSSIRDAMMLRNPFDQWLRPFSHRERGLSVTGHDMLGGDSNPLAHAGGVGLEMATDPLSWIGAGAVFKGVSAATRAAKAGSAVSRVAPQAAKAIKPVTAASIASPVAGAYLMADNPEQSGLKNAIGMGLMAAPLAMAGPRAIRGVKHLTRKPKDISRTVRSGRQSGAVLHNAVLPRNYVTPELEALSRTLRPKEVSVLDAGSGKHAVHAVGFRKKGYSVDAIDLPENMVKNLHNPDAFTRQHHVGYSSRVLNTMESQEDLDKFLEIVSRAIRSDGVYYANLPRTPRYNAWAGMTNKQARHQLEVALQKHFGKVEHLGDRSGPVYRASKPRWASGEMQSKGFPLMSLLPFGVAGGGALARASLSSQEQPQSANPLTVVMGTPPQAGM